MYHVRRAAHVFRLFNVLYEIRRRLTYNDVAFAPSVREGAFTASSRCIGCMNVQAGHPQANICSFEFIASGGGPSGLSRVRQLYFRRLWVWLFVSITAVRCGPPRKMSDPEELSCWDIPRDEDCSNETERESMCVCVCLRETRTRETKRDRKREGYAWGERRVFVTKRNRGS